MYLREEIIEKLFKSWITKDESYFKSVFSKNAVYIESWGPYYGDLSEILIWFREWNRTNNVLAWDIKTFIHDKNISVCEWYFKCECYGKVDDFNGVTLFEFDDQNKIVFLKEFQSKLPNYRPYLDTDKYKLR